MDNTIGYLNTDLDVMATVDLNPLAAAFEASGFLALHVTECDDGLWRATFETDEQFHEPEPNIVAMLTAIESLGPDLRATWNACALREFNLGYDCGEKPWAFNQGLSNETLARIVAVGATLRWTLYPDRPPPNPASRERL